MPADLTALCEHDHGRVLLSSGEPARGATARVYVDRGGELRPVAVFADPRGGQKLEQPLKAGGDGCLPGYFHGRHRRRLVVVASYRGRVIDSVAQAAFDERARDAAAQLAAAAEAAAARDADRAEYRREQRRRAAEQRASDRLKALEERAAKQASLVADKRAAHREDYRVRILARVQEKRALAQRESIEAGLQSLSTVVIGQPVKILLGTPGNEVVSIDQRGFNPSYDPHRGIAVLNITPGFGLTDDGRAYYAFDAPSAGDAAFLDFAQDHDLLLVKP